jgi:adenine-specific DNA-methyltransferase
MATKNSGALALTWANKQLRLLSHENGTYEWVDPSDFRVSEVRLLNDVKSSGQVHGDKNRVQDNLLIRGDSLHALTSLLRIPEFAAEYEGKVKLVYIDPPFNTGQAFEHYDDGLEHSVWLTMLRDRLVQIKRLLRDDGSVWVHLDDYEQHRGRSVLDEVFGAQNFVATFIWEKLYARKSNAPVSNNHDYIHMYAKSSKFTTNKLAPSDEQLARYQNRDNDPRGPWQSVAFHVRTDNVERRSEYRYDITLPSGRSVQPPNGRHWNGKRPRYNALLADNRLWFGPDGDALPRYKQFLDMETIGLTPATVWPRGEVGDNEESKHEVQALFPEIADVFSTPKPERLMQRIIHIASNPGDIVLDCFAGSGTTAAVAHKMGRRWVTCEWSAENIAAFTLPRLEKVVNGEDPGGVTREVGWEGGGGFRLLDIAPSVYEVMDNTVLLSETVTSGQLAESVAAQLGFDYEPNGMFSGQKGRMRLSVVDGVLNDDIARLLVGALQEKERITVVATACEPGAEDLVRNLAPGSRVRKVPRDLARLSARRSDVVQLVLDGLEVSV